MALSWVSEENYKPGLRFRSWLAEWMRFEYETLTSRSLGRLPSSLATESATEAEIFFGEARKRGRVMQRCKA